MDPLRKAWWTVVLALLAIGVGVRVLGASGELWLDEIWTLNLLAERAPTPFHVFWSVQHDNVHPLYGFYAWFLPDYPHPLLYRAPAIILGAGTIIVAGIIGLRGSRAEALIAIAASSITMRTRSGHRSTRKASRRRCAGPQPASGRGSRKAISAWGIESCSTSRASPTSRIRFLSRPGR